MVTIIWSVTQRLKLGLFYRELMSNINSNQQFSLGTLETKTIDQIRKDGIDKQMLERIAAERQEMQRIKQEQKERLPGQFVALKQDWDISETRNAMTGFKICDMGNCCRTATKKIRHYLPIEEEHLGPVTRTHV